MNRKIENILTGNLEIISFKKFVELLPHTASPTPLYYWFNTRVGHFSPVTIEKASSTVTEDAVYSRSVLGLLRAESVEEAEDIYKAQLFTQLGIHRLWKGDLREMIHSVILRSLDNFGIPTHLVRLSPRTWLLTNTDYFSRISYNKEEGKPSHTPVGLACYNRTVPMIYKIEHHTEAQMVDSYKKFAEDHEARAYIQGTDEQILEQIRKGF